MKLNKIKTISDFLIYCRMPIYFKSQINKMNVGDIFFLGQYKEAIPNSDAHFIAEAWIEKERGQYTFNATWTMSTKSRRPLIMTSGSFNISKGGHIKFDDELEEVKQFSLVCRYIGFYLRYYPIEMQKYFDAHSKPLFIGVWLDKNYISKEPYFDTSIQKYLYLDYQDYAPTHQLKAIIDVGMAMGAIPKLSASSVDTEEA